MDERLLKWFYDAMQAARAIQQFTEMKTFEDFTSNEQLQAAIERKFEILGEALITDHAAIIGFRNILAHGYDQIDETIVWGIVCEKVPVLIRELERIPDIE